MAGILFLCGNNGARSQMAEAFARSASPDGTRVASAGLVAGAVHPLVIQVMAEIGADISGQRPKALADLADTDFDLVVTLCQRLAEHCPVLPGNPERVEWDVPDPETAVGAEADALPMFRRCRDLVRTLVLDLFGKGYYDALIRARRKSELVLNNISDGIIAHDMRRVIFYFNTAAERITGYTRAEVMNRDCHQIFGGAFCGAACPMSEPADKPSDSGPRQCSIVARDGTPRSIDLMLRALRDSSGEAAGVLVLFSDRTRERELARRLGEVERFSGIVGRHPRMLEIFDMIRDLAEVSAPVLIQGESGTGKELVAAAIHNEGPRAGNPFVAVNCAAMPEGLLESEMFGHVKGAFTGAIRDKKGRFELAGAGTIFLDEVGDISPAMQVKLLRVLQEGVFERVGGETTLRSEARVISATNKDLRREIAAGRFREDLYYRLSVVPLTIPPLRERATDIPLLAAHILERAARESERPRAVISDAAMDVLMSYHWPGNVRELQNWLQFALIKSKGGVIEPGHLPAACPVRAAPGPVAGRVRKLDAASVRAALQKYGGNRVAAAKTLGVSRATLYRFLAENPYVAGAG